MLNKKNKKKTAEVNFDEIVREIIIIYVAINRN